MAKALIRKKKIEEAAEQHQGVEASIGGSSDDLLPRTTYPRNARQGKGKRVSHGAARRHQPIEAKSREVTRGDGIRNCRSGG